MVAVITGAGHAFADTSTQSDLWAKFFDRHYSGNALARRMFTSVSVNARHAVANPIVENISGWSTAERMRRYVAEASPLATNAVRDALSAASLDPAEVGLIAVVSCTGYASPGVDSLAARDAGLTPSTQRLSIGHMGCYAALPGISTVANYVTAQQRAAVLVCVELTSLHIQPPSNDVDQIIAHALFSDAASAVVLQPAKGGLEVVDVETLTDIEHAQLMTWSVTDLGFLMGLSQKIPDVLATHLQPFVRSLLDRHDLVIDDVAAWAAHPGGPRILDVIEQELKLPPNELSESRKVLAEHGNCSSATVLIVLDEICKNRDLQAGQFVVALAFGPGLTLCAVLLRAN